MKELDEREFGNIFYSNIVSLVKPFEKKRKELNFNKKIKHILERKIPMFFGILIFLDFLIFLLTSIIHGVKDPNGLIIGYLFGGLIVSFWFICPICLFVSTAFFSDIDISVKNFKKIIKDRIIEKLLSCMDLEYNRTNEHLNKLYLSALSQLEINNAKVDDIITGDYKGSQFHIVEYRSLGCEKDVFIGKIMLATRIHKSFNGDTVISSNKIFTFNSKIEKLEKTLLEDIEFNKTFAIYTNNEIDTRYLLTPSFIERLKKFEKKWEKDFKIYFTRKTYLDSNIFFLIDIFDDFFEIDLNKSLLDKENYYGIYREIKEILDIVETLKLDQNIGM